MRSGKGLTFVEVLVVIAILALLVALGVPVFRTAVDAAKRATSASNLKQISYQTMLYQVDNGGDGIFGTSYSMGLPPWPQSDRLSALASLKPPKAPRPGSNLGQLYFTLYTDPTLDMMPTTWKEYASFAREHSVLYIDPFDNDSTISLMVGNLVTRRFLAIDVSGSLVKRRGRGDWMLRGWWLDETP